jgi:hypothetical protein
VSEWYQWQWVWEWVHPGAQTVTHRSYERERVDKNVRSANHHSLTLAATGIARSPATYFLSFRNHNCPPPPRAHIGMRSEMSACFMFQSQAVKSSMR